MKQGPSLKITSRHAGKKLHKFYITEHIILTVFSIIGFYTLCLFGPFFISGKRRGSKDLSISLIELVVENQIPVLLAGLVIAVVVNVWVARVRNKLIIVSIDMDREQTVIESRYSKVESIKKFTVNTSELRIVKTKISLSPVFGNYPCYKFYRNDEYLGAFIPDHFIWDSDQNWLVKQVEKTLNEW